MSHKTSKLPQNDQSSQPNLPLVRITPAKSTVGDLTELNSATLADLDESFTTSSTRSTLSPAPPAISTTKIKRVSWVYKHMANTDNTQALFRNDEDREIWPCKYCYEKGKKKDYIVGGGRLKIERHLQNEHRIYQDSAQETRQKNQQMSIQETINTAALNTAKRRKLAEEDITEKKLDGAVIEALYVKWVATDNQALGVVECPAFRSFLTYINSNTNVSLPSSRSTITEWVLRQFTLEKDRVKQRVQSARTKIHISCDIWTSPSTLPIVGVIGHYINEDNMLEHTVIGMKKIIGTHDGDSVSRVVYKVLMD